ncbi:DinB family protein [Virgibacillus sp. NKC19-3]|uniref:DinB family protein n=1 Tax=Virgibacillus saliphilus TaxID=2831674 RepID=UPI001C9A8E87|nr:DinB family protein [Virgibacillus sp. NKC19-3]MBY7142765.1 DinB family protein [Virgibacillus sp. NKC19-3]
MSHLFNFTRNTFLSFIKDLDEKTADYQAEAFNNTIHWHVGHVLVTTEGLLLGYPKQSANFPEKYNDLFATGTKPADWPSDVPAISELGKLLEEQQTRINDLPDDFFKQGIPFEFMNFKTYGDIFDMLLHHENEHLGKMKAMKQVADAAQ